MSAGNGAMYGNIQGIKNLMSHYDKDGDYINPVNGLMRFVRRNNMIGFVIWSLFGVFIIGLGIKDMFSKNPVGFWANTETIKVKDVKGYNRTTGLLFIIYGIIFIILGIPLLEGQNTPYVLLAVIGVMVETIAIMAAYSLVIVKKYEEK